MNSYVFVSLLKTGLIQEENTGGRLSVKQFLFATVSSTALHGICHLSCYVQQYLSGEASQSKSLWWW